MLDTFELCPGELANLARQPFFGDGGELVCHDFAGLAASGDDNYSDSGGYPNQSSRPEDIEP